MEAELLRCPICWPMMGSLWAVAALCWSELQGRGKLVGGGSESKKETKQSGAVWFGWGLLWTGEESGGLSVKKRDDCAEMRGMTVGLVGEERKRELLWSEGAEEAARRGCRGSARGGLWLPTKR